MVPKHIQWSHSVSPLTTITSKSSNAIFDIRFQVVEHFLHIYRTESGDWLQRVDWHKIAVFKPQLRELTVNYLSKGQRVMVNGKVSYGEIKDREGAARATTTIIAEEIIFFQ